MERFDVRVELPSGRSALVQGEVMRKLGGDISVMAVQTGRYEDDQFPLSGDDLRAAAKVLNPGRG